MTELWKAVVGWETLYEVSNCGRVRNATTQRLRKPKATQWGYWRMALADSGKYSTFSLHRLVAEAFIGPRPAGMEVNHKDGNKGNNQADNLEYVTKSENVRHAMRLGLVNPTAKLPQDTKGEANGRAILTAADVVDIRNKWRAGIDSKTIASQYGLADKYVWRVASGQTWKHVA